MTPNTKAPGGFGDPLSAVLSPTDEEILKMPFTMFLTFLRKQKGNDRYPTVDDVISEYEKMDDILTAFHRVADAMNELHQPHKALFDHRKDGSDERAVWVSFGRLFQNSYNDFLRNRSTMNQFMVLDVSAFERFMDAALYITEDISKYGITGTKSDWTKNPPSEKMKNPSNMARDRGDEDTSDK